MGNKNFSMDDNDNDDSIQAFLQRNKLIQVMACRCPLFSFLGSSLRTTRHDPVDLRILHLSIARRKKMRGYLVCDHVCMRAPAE